MNRKEKKYGRPHEWDGFEEWAQRHVPECSMLGCSDDADVMWYDGTIGQFYCNDHTPELFSGESILSVSTHLRKYYATWHTGRRGYG